MGADVPLLKLIQAMPGSSTDALLERIPHIKKTTASRALLKMRSKRVIHSVKISVTYGNGNQRRPGAHLWGGGMNAPAYYPRPGTLAAQVVAFFRSNPGEELTLDDITAKFDAGRNNIHTQLRPAVEVGLLVRTRNADGEYIYTAGARIDVISTTGDTPASPAPKARKPSGFASPRHHVDLSALVVEKGVPLPQQRAKLVSKWEPQGALNSHGGNFLPHRGNLHWTKNHLKAKTIAPAQGWRSV